MARRKIKIDLRLNESEAAMLNRDVEKSGLSREAYLREFFHLFQVFLLGSWCRGFAVLIFFLG